MERIHNIDCYIMFSYTFFDGFLDGFFMKFVFFYYFYHFDIDVSNLRNKILTNQKQEFVIINWQWNYLNKTRSSGSYHKVCLLTSIAYRL